MCIFVDPSYFLSFSIGLGFSLPIVLHQLFSKKADDRLHESLFIWYECPMQWIIHFQVILQLVLMFTTIYATRNNALLPWTHTAGNNYLSYFLFRKHHPSFPVTCRQPCINPYLQAANIWITSWTRIQQPRPSSYCQHSLPLTVYYIYTIVCIDP